MSDNYYNNGYLIDTISMLECQTSNLHKWSAYNDDAILDELVAIEAILMKIKNKAQLAQDGENSNRDELEAELNSVIGYKGEDEV